jgi:hypothetical protein
MFYFMNAFSLKSNIIGLLQAFVGPKLRISGPSII